MSVFSATFDFQSRWDLLISFVTRVPTPNKNKKHVLISWVAKAHRGLTLRNNGCPWFLPLPRLDHTLQWNYTLLAHGICPSTPETTMPVVFHWYHFGCLEMMLCTAESMQKIKRVWIKIGINCSFLFIAFLWCLHFICHHPYSNADHFRQKRWPLSLVTRRSRTFSLHLLVGWLVGWLVSSLTNSRCGSCGCDVQTRSQTSSHIDILANKDETCIFLASYLMGFLWFLTTVEHW